MDCVGFVELVVTPVTCVDAQQFPVADRRCEIVSNECVGNHLYVMWLKPQQLLIGQAKQVGFTCMPGQFVMLDLPTDSGAFYLRRPMSVYATRPDGSLAIFYKVHGKGTGLMSQLKPGETMDVLGPLGNTFTLPNEADLSRMLLIGGGIGIAPMVALAQWLKAQGRPVPKCIYGVRSEAEVSIDKTMDKVFGADGWKLATDDGSAGFSGNVCQLLQAEPDWLNHASRVAVCGPMPMMKAMAKLAQQQCPDVPIEVSLEERMPCGTGACTGCVVQTTTEELPVKTCLYGPIFDANTLIWPGEVPPVSSGVSCERGGASCPA